jgi:hypothetical protein
LAGPTASPLLQKMMRAAFSLIFFEIHHDGMITPAHKNKISLHLFSITIMDEIIGSLFRTGDWLVTRTFEIGDFLR